MNPLNDVPLNNKRSYVMGTTYSGCEIYMPVDSYDDDILKNKKNELQKYLDNQLPIDNQPMLA